MTEPGAVATAASSGSVTMQGTGTGPRVAVGVHGVAKRFATQIALHPLDLTVTEGEFVTLLGPSGCGKTTLLRIIAGLEIPDDGTVSIFGADVTDRPANKRPVNLVFQRVTLFPHLTVAENVGFGPRLRRTGKQQAAEKVRSALELVRLPDFGGRRVTELSGGQAQRVALARAIANDPRVLLLDEPLSALDLEIRRQLQAELKEIHRRLGLTFVYVTHDQEEAMSMSDRVVVMKDGRIEQVGSPVEIYRRPRSPFVARFLGMSNVVEALVTAAADGWLELAGAGLPLRVPAPAAGPAPSAGQRVTAVIRPDSFEITRLADGPASAGSASAGPAPDGSGADGEVTGEVTDVRFIGSVVHYVVTAAGQGWQVSTRAGSAEVLPEGAKVRLTWRPGEVIVMSSSPNRTE
jgi:spermidine/putrescine transport system ATP-binding protein